MKLHEARDQSDAEGKFYLMEEKMNSELELK